VSDKDKRPVDRPEWANTTSTQMLAAAKAGNPDSWRGMVRLYAPLVLWWCRQGFPPWQHSPALCGVPGQDAADVVQEVFQTVRKKIKTFTKDGKPAAFRRWLKTITRFKVREYWAIIGEEPLPIGGSGSWTVAVSDKRPLPGEEASDGETVSERVLLLRRVLDLIRPEFECRTWKAFWRVAAAERSAKDVAAELGMSVPAVHTAKSRVLKRLKQELKALGFDPIKGNMVAADAAGVTQSEVTS